jgi:hypothetical protein
MPKSGGNNYTHLRIFKTAYLVESRCANIAQGARKSSFAGI